MRVQWRVKPGVEGANVYARHELQVVVVQGFGPGHKKNKTCKMHYAIYRDFLSELFSPIDLGLPTWWHIYAEHPLKTNSGYTPAVYYSI